MILDRFMYNLHFGQAAFPEMQAACIDFYKLGCAILLEQGELSGFCFLQR